MNEIEDTELESRRMEYDLDNPSEWNHYTPEEIHLLIEGETPLDYTQPEEE